MGEIGGRQECLDRGDDPVNGKNSRPRRAESEEEMVDDDDGNWTVDLLMPGRLQLIWDAESASTARLDSEGTSGVCCLG